MHYFDARFYNNNIARFTVVDARIGDISNPMTLNRYTYVNNNLMRYVDPTGHGEEVVHHANGLEKTFQERGLEGVRYHADSIKWASDIWGVDPKLMSSILYVEDMQQIALSLESFGFLKKIEDTLGKNFVAKKLLCVVGTSTGVMRTKRASMMGALLVAQYNHYSVMVKPAEGENPAVFKEGRLNLPELKQLGSYGHFQDLVNQKADALGLEGLDRLICASNLEDFYGAAAIIRISQEIYKDNGVDISQNIGISGTLYNIGLRIPKPDSSPRTGGSVVNLYLNGQTFENMNFGDRVQKVYDSGILDSPLK